MVGSSLARDSIVPLVLVSKTAGTWNLDYRCKDHIGILMSTHRYSICTSHTLINYVKADHEAHTNTLGRNESMFSVRGNSHRTLVLAGHTWSY